MKLILTCLLFITFQFSYSQTKVYTASIKGHEVGEMRVQREISDNKVEIKTNVNIEAHFIFTLHVKYEITSIYQNDQLIESKAIAHQNGHLKHEIYVDKVNGRYKVNKDGEVSYFNVDNIYGADLFYFEEPDEVDQTFAVFTLEFMDIEKGDGHEYFFEHDGKKEIIDYTGGSVDKIKIEHRFYDILLERKD